MRDETACKSFHELRKSSQRVLWLIFAAKKLSLFWTEVTCGAVGGRLRLLKQRFLSAAISLKILGYFLLLFDVDRGAWKRE